MPSISGVSLGLTNLTEYFFVAYAYTNLRTSAASEAVSVTPRAYTLLGYIRSRVVFLLCVVVWIKLICLCTVIVQHNRLVVFAASEAVSVTPRAYTLLGFRMKKSEADPETKVEYTEGAVGLTPAFA